jgi:hypothetical protein
MLPQNKISEIRKYIKKVAKRMKEGSTTDGAGAYHTPAAFTGDPNDPGSHRAIGADKTYIVKPPKKKRNFVKLHEANYVEFKKDSTRTSVNKVNTKILEAYKMLREARRAIRHATKLKQEANVSDNKHWKRTTLAYTKIAEMVDEIGIMLYGK